jgi:uncharacterized SAM-binding protein YcdF (DUF218 family)
MDNFMNNILIIFVLATFSFNTYADLRLSERMEDLNKIVISGKNIRTDIISGRFDKVFSLYNNIQSEKHNMQYFSSIIDTTNIANKLAGDQRDIIDYSYKTIKKNTGKIIPRTRNYRPSGLIVLGATPKIGILESRLNQAYKFAVKYPDMPIVLSGKGLKEGVVEADYMYNYLIAKGVGEDRLYKESESLDTVGNAEFSYFTISENYELNEIENWLVITNNYHSMRALYSFSQVFPKNYTISVLLSPLLPDGVTNPNKDKILKDLVTNEVKSDSNEKFMELLKYHRYSVSRDSFKTKDITGKPCAILNEMLLEHDLYKDKVDKFMIIFSQCY